MDNSDVLISSAHHKLQQAADEGQPRERAYQVRLLALTVASVVLAYCLPQLTLLGTAVGCVGHYLWAPTLSIDFKESSITPFHVTCAVVGAVAALIRYTPAGVAGGCIFKAIPLIMSCSIGSAIYSHWRVRNSEMD